MDLGTLLRVLGFSAGKLSAWGTKPWLPISGHDLEGYLGPLVARSPFRSGADQSGDLGADYPGPS